jgi:hypothetical protein
LHQIHQARGGHVVGQSAKAFSIEQIRATSTMMRLRQQAVAE